MDTTTIRVSRDARRALRSMAVQEGKSMQEILEEAIEVYRRRRMLELGNQAYAALRADPKAWEHELAERRLWENTLADGLEK
jgi:predicted CopG family antitoxin